MRGLTVFRGVWNPSNQLTFTANPLKTEVEIMLNKLMFSLCVLFFLNLGVYAQSTCSCSNSSCSASQTCNAGYTASCTCQAAGCSSSCSKDSELILEFAEPDFEKAIQAGDPKSIRQFFARTIGKIVEFTPASKSFRNSYSKSKSGVASDWNALEVLSGNGDLKIQGHPLKFWADIRDSFLKGGELIICTSRADAALREIAFISGKKFSVISGDSRAPIKAPIKGNGLEDMLQSLRKAANIEIVEL